jgi:hypothetical protein
MSDFEKAKDEAAELHAHDQVNCKPSWPTVREPFMNREIEYAFCAGGEWARDYSTTELVNTEARLHMALDERDALKAEVKRLKAELKLYMQSEKIWQDNCGVAGRDALPKERAKARRLAEALTEGDYNSIRETLALMAEGEGDDAQVYMQMSKAALDKLDKALAEYEGEKE